MLRHVDHDVFNIKYKTSPKLDNESFIKRLILSAIASVFNPLDLIAPIIIICTVFIQKLWMSKVDWDEPIKGALVEYWLDI